MSKKRIKQARKLDRRNKALRQAFEAGHIAAERVEFFKALKGKKHVAH